MERLTAIGSSVCFASGILAVADGSNPIVVFLGIASGIAIGIVGIVQRLKSEEVKHLLTRQAELYDEVRMLQEEVLSCRAMEARHIEEMSRRLCPNSVDGKAYCFGGNGPHRKHSEPEPEPEPEQKGA